MDSRNQQELILKTISEFLIEPVFKTPLTLGMYSKWGSGKSTQMHRLVGKQYSPLLNFHGTKGSLIQCIKCLFVNFIVTDG